MSVEKTLEGIEALLLDMRKRIEGLEDRLKPEPLCLTYPEAAKRLGVGLTKLKELVRGGEIRKSMVGRVPMISMTEIQRVSTPEPERPRAERQQRKAAWVPIPIGKKR
jgi:excisionase family DNA binding protein